MYGNAKSERRGTVGSCGSVWFALIRLDFLIFFSSEVERLLTDMFTPARPKSSAARADGLDSFGLQGWAKESGRKIFLYTGN
jgi:hypothetical protein